MSQNYLGDLIYTYDKYRNRDFYKNLYLDPDFSCIGYMPEEYEKRYGSCAIEFNNNLYIIGGCSIFNDNTLATLRDMKNDIFIYNIEKNDYEKVQIESLVTYNQFGVIEKAELLIGSTTVIEYNEIEEVEEINFPKISNAQILTLGEYVYVIGGLAKQNYYIDDELKINPYSSSILRSKDMINWEIVKTSLLGIGNLSQHRCCVFGNEIYLIFENSVYKSANGINWTNLLSTRYEDNLEGQFCARYDFGFVTVGEYMYVFGGTDGRITLNDVWYSNNGKYWTKKIYYDDEGNPKDAPWENRYAFGCVKSEVYDTIMIIGGKKMNISKGDDFQYTLSDVWITQDFESWEKANIEISPRSQMTVVSYKKSIIIIGGIYDTLLEYSSDTWSLDLYDDIYSISPPGEYLAIDAIVGTFIAGKLKVGRTIILESSYDLYDEYILEDYKYKNGTNPNSIVHKI